GSRLRPRAMCSTTKIDARRSRGSSATIRLIASTPPAEAPMTTTSCLAIATHLFGAKLCKLRDVASRDRIQPRSQVGYTRVSGIAVIFGRASIRGSLEIRQVRGRALTFRQHRSNHSSKLRREAGLREAQIRAGFARALRLFAECVRAERDDGDVAGE